MSDGRGLSLAAAGALLLFFGTFDSVLAKTLLSFQSTGWGGVAHYFEKPGFQCFLMFCGCSFSLPMGTCWGPYGTYRLKDFDLRHWVLPVFVSLGAAFGVFLETIGLMRVNASVYQMLRGSLTISSTLWALLILKRRFPAYQWIGMGLSAAALVIVGIAGVQITGINNRYGWGQRLLGVIAILSAEIGQGAQMVYNEWLLKRADLPVMFVVGMDGIWGIVFEMLILQWVTFLIPGKDPFSIGGSFEFWGDTWLMLGHSWQLSAISIGLILSIGGYNVWAMTVTARGSAVHRTIFEALRTMTTWASMLIIGAFDSSFGEKWQKWSWLQLGGFAVLVYASLVFNRVVKFPGITYLNEEPLLDKPQDSTVSGDVSGSDRALI
jgi:drug/metabolite transporter (DMT)-like permease